MIGGVREPEPIVAGDIKYQDELVCILEPNVKKGIIVWHQYVQPQGMESLCELGLKTGEKMKAENIVFNRSIYHPYIFFKAPYYSRDIDYTSVEKEIISSYGEGQTKYPRAFIRVDPDKTFVFSSEIRAIWDWDWYGEHETIINNSKKTLSEYLKIINKNEEIIKNLELNEKYCIIYLQVKQKYFQKMNFTAPVYNTHNIERHSEILVSTPHLTKEHFVLCTR